MDWQVVLSDFFISDLKEIVDFLVKHAGAEFASRMGHELIDRALEAGRQPFAGQPVKSHSNTRKILHHRYLIYYDINPEKGRIEVLRIWHSARDPKTLRLR